MRNEKRPDPLCIILENTPADQNLTLLFFSLTQSKANQIKSIKKSKNSPPHTLHGVRARRALLLLNVVGSLSAPAAHGVRLVVALAKTGGTFRHLADKIKYQ